jgi:opacity protein-like surface antigen
MKKSLLFVSVILLLSSGIFAQTISLSGFGGFTFQDKVAFNNAFGYIKESGHWGFSLEGINNGSGHAIELLYQQQNTHVPLYYYSFPNIQINPKDETAISYIMLNGVQYLMHNPRIWPYGGLGIGAAVVKINGENSQLQTYSNTETKFAWDVKLGVKIKATPVIGIKLQAQLFSVVQAAGGGFYVGTGGAGVGVSSYSTIYQFGFTGGISIDLDKNKMKNGSGNKPVNN